MQEENIQNEEEYSVEKNKFENEVLYENIDIILNSEKKNKLNRSNYNTIILKERDKSKNVEHLENKEEIKENVIKSNINIEKVYLY